MYVEKPEGEYRASDEIQYAVLYAEPGQQRRLLFDHAPNMIPYPEPKLKPEKR